MLAQDTHHPDMMNWEVDEDLRRAKLIVRSHMQSKEPVGRVNSDLIANEVNPYRPPRAPHIRFDRGTNTAARAKRSPSHAEGNATPLDFRESKRETLADIEYPRSAQGGWRPWIFALTGFVGGNLAMTLGGISPNYLPTIVVAEIVLGIIVCIAFYPRRTGVAT